MPTDYIAAASRTHSFYHNKYLSLWRKLMNAFIRILYCRGLHFMQIALCDFKLESLFLNYISMSIRFYADRLHNNIATGAIAASTYSLYQIFVIMTEHFFWPLLFLAYAWVDFSVSSAQYYYMMIVRYSGHCRIAMSLCICDIHNR